MKTSTPSIERIGLKVGLLTSLGLITYFMVMKAFGLHDIIELRFFNFFILLGGVVYAIRKFKRESEEGEFYLMGLAEGMYTSAVAVVSFGIFMSFYLAYFDTALMKHIQSSVTMGEYINGLTIFFTIAMEGLASGAIITLCAMQYFKSDSAEKKEEPQKKTFSHSGKPAME